MSVIEILTTDEQGPMTSLASRLFAGWRRRAVCCLFALGVSMAPAGVPVWADDFEVPSNRRASEILPAEMIKGPFHQVRETVVSYGYMHEWTVDSDFGQFTVVGDGALRALIREIHAIAELGQISQSEAFADSIAYAAKQPFEFAGKMVTDPVDTVTALPKGVFRIFENVGEAVTMEKDPTEDSRLKQALFVSSWKRDYAAERNVDVYSSNTVLQEQLNKVGWAAAIGGISVSGALTAVGGPGAMVVSNTRLANQVSEVLKEEPPSRLRIINQEKLVAMGLSQDLTERFLDHPHFSPHHDTIMAAALADLKEAKGRDSFIEAIMPIVQDEVAATFYMNQTQTLQAYSETVAPISDIVLANGLFVATAADGSVVIPFPLDHGVWTQRASQVLGHLKRSHAAGGDSGKYALWVAGTLSPLAREKLTATGFEAQENIDERYGFLD